MPKLLIATTIYRMIEEFLLPYAAHFRRLGWEVDALAAGEPSPSIAPNFDQMHQATWSRNPISPRNLSSMPRVIRGLHAERQYDIVHAHTPIAAFVTRYALRAQRRTGTPRVVYTAHGFHFHSNGSRLTNAAFIQLERLAGQWTDRLVVINEDDALAATAYRIVPPESLVRVPGIGIDLAAYNRDCVSAEDISRFRADIGLEAGVPYFLVVAEFTKNKRHANIVRALSSINGLGARSPHLVFAGYGTEQRRIQKLARELSIETRVHFLGYRKDVPVLMRGAAALVLASAREGLPRCVLEAMALGVPVIGTAARGTADLLSDGCGLVVPIDDVGALASAIVHVLACPQAVAECGRRALQRVQRYDIGRLLDMQGNIYEALLQSENHEPFLQRE